MNTMTEKAFALPREALAKAIVDHGRTIAVLMDERPGLDRDAARAVSGMLAANGYLVHEVTVTEFCEKNLATLGFGLLIPHAVSVPAVCAEPLRKYWMQGGQVVTLGGPLFADLIEADGDGRFAKVPLDDQTLDATFSGRMPPFVMEGFAPTYKVYLVDNAKDFRLAQDQVIAGATIASGQAERVVCPSARPHGLGYDMDRRNRYIPLVEVSGEGGRAGGRRGAAAFLMLSNTRCHLPVTNGNRPGSVSATTIGSAAAGIGLTRQDILRVDGMEALLLSLFGAMRRGLFLFEGGSERFVCRPGDTIRLGATLLNVGQDFEDVTVRCTVTDGEHRAVYQADTLAMPRNMTHVQWQWTAQAPGTYAVAVELLFKGEVIDRIEHALQVPAARVAQPDDFVAVRDGEFILHGKPWPAFGINYWPHYYPGFEREDYWLGWLDKSNYDPLEVERDLEQMEAMGYTCLFTRLDGNVFERTLPQLQDFMLRMERHHMKLSLSYCNATCPVNYQPSAFRRLMALGGLQGNPTLFGHDIAWEIGSQFYSGMYGPQWDARWADWLRDRYGSLEAAAQDWGVPVPLAVDGRPTAPPLQEFQDDGPWRVRTAAYRRFLDDMVSRLWNDAVADMRAVDPDHIISYRMGSIGHTTTALTATNKHIDYASPEGYTIQHSEQGYDASCCITLLMDALTSGKPVVWSEFGMSLTDVRWRSLIWDNVHFRPYPHKIEEQGSYLAQFTRMFKATGVRGSAPWWYAGGFRMVEMSDFGLVGPDGVPRPAAKDYAAMRAWFDRPREQPAPDKTVTLDADAHAGGYGHLLFGDNIHNPLHRTGRDPNAPKEMLGEGLLAYRNAAAQGKRIAFRTPGMGTTSADTPLLAVGNTPYSGANPPKYLNAEFNWARVTLPDGTARCIRPNAEVKVPRGAPLLLDAGIGNLREATWLSPANAKAGGVYLVSTDASELAVKAPIGEDVPYLGDAVLRGIPLAAGIDRPVSVALRMAADGRMAFGEVLRFTLVPEDPAKEAGA